MLELLEIIFAPIEGEYISAVWWGLPIILSAFANAATSYGLSQLQGEPEQPSGIPPPSGAGGFGVPQIDLSQMGQPPQQTPEYGAGGSTFGQAMAAYQPMRLSDVLRPQISLGEGQFSLGKQKRRFQ